MKAQVTTESNFGANQYNSPTLKVSEPKSFSRAITFQRSIQAPSEKSIQDKKSEKDEKPYRKGGTINEEGSIDSQPESRSSSRKFGFGK